MRGIFFLPSSLLLLVTSALAAAPTVDSLATFGHVSELQCTKNLRSPPTYTDQGLPPNELKNLAAYARENKIFLAIRKPNDGAYAYHGVPNVVAKPMRVRIRTKSGGKAWEFFNFKSAQIGPNHGLVARPSAETFDLASTEFADADRIWKKDWEKFSKAGFTTNAEGVVFDPNGTRYFSDYDIVIAFDTYGIRKSFGEGGDELPRVKALLSGLNQAVGGTYFRHDGYFEPEYFELLRMSSFETIFITPWGEVFTTTASTVYRLFMNPWIVR